MAAMPLTPDFSKFILSTQAETKVCLATRIEKPHVNLEEFSVSAESGGDVILEGVKFLREHQFQIDVRTANLVVGTRQISQNSAAIYVIRRQISVEKKRDRDSSETNNMLHVSVQEIPLAAPAEYCRAL